MAMIEEIYEEVLPYMRANGIEDTPVNRIGFLRGVRDAWLEDDTFHPQKPYYIMAITLEIERLKVQMLSRVC